jgi:threonine dehydratase
MIDHYLGRGDKHFVISSSGNAALAAGLHVAKINSDSKQAITLDILVGKNIAPHKLEKLKSIESDLGKGHIRVLIKERPLISLNEAIGEGKRSLRQSTDNIALIGYKSLSEELSEIKNAGAIFIGTSSGTTAQALAQYVIDNKLQIQIHIVQTSSCHPISDSFETYDGPDEKSIADAIVSKTSERSPKLVSLINETNGYGWTATNEEINTAKELVQKHTGLDISQNSALSVVGAMQAVYRDWQIDGSVICLICGE